VRIPALERDFALDVFSRLHVLEMKPGFVNTTAGRGEDEISYMARFMLSLADTPVADYIDAVQAGERLKDGYAEYFQKYDVLLTPVLPTPSFKHNQAELLINGQTVKIMGIMSATSPLNVTGLPAFPCGSAPAMTECQSARRSLVAGKPNPRFFMSLHDMAYRSS
jgi:aspartyl-tRNA(Asn)/glutamyl-tRNA(Gln) amidotransferase subunit A